MAKSTERHKRERLAKLGDKFSISAEQIRRAGIAKANFSDAEELMQSGEMSVNRLYKLAKGDRRVGLHIMIPPELRERIKQSAKDNGATVNELLTEVLTKIFW